MSRLPARTRDVCKEGFETEKRRWGFGGGGDEVEMGERKYGWQGGRGCINPKVTISARERTPCFTAKIGIPRESRLVWIECDSRPLDSDRSSVRRLLVTDVVRIADRG